MREGLIPDVEVLEEFESAEQLNEAEIFLIAYWKMLGADLTNMTIGGDGGPITHHDSLLKMSFPGERNPFFGMKHSEETKKKISLSKLGIPSGRRGKSNTWMMKRVRCVEDDLEFSSIKEAAAHYGVKHNVMSNVVCGKTKRAAGRRFEYVK